MANDPSTGSLIGRRQVEVFGADLEGSQFFEQTTVLTISRDSATIALAHKLAPDSEFIIRNPMTNEEATARVVDVVRTVQDPIFFHVYGIVFINPSVNPWQRELPEVQPKETIPMECSRCNMVDAVLLSEIEMEILGSKQALRRYCECSNSSTIWKQADRSVAKRRATERVVRDRQREISSSKKLSIPPPENRREKRTTMKVAACLRCYDGERVVECEDVSRGGFCFKSRRAYPAGMRFEVAVPYAKNSVNIFVTARIVYQQELSDRYFRHGVAYVKTVKRAESKS